MAFWGLAVPGLGQSFLIDYTREGAWRYTRQAETPYQRNAQVIQHQLTTLGKKLNQLSVIDPLMYSQLQSELHGYLQRLENQPPDYGSAAVYHSVLLRLMQVEESIKETLVESRRHNLGEDAHSPAIDFQVCEGQQLAVLPYALLFQRQDYRSKLVHIVTSQSVIVLKQGSSYWLVQCGPHQGYLHRGMIVSSQRAY